MTEKTKGIHFGHLIKDVLTNQGRRMTWFAQQMNCDRANLYRLLERDHLDTGFVTRASIVLNHDFYLEASEKLHITGN